MPYVKSNGIRIYYQVDGEGVPLIMQHGLTGSLEDFYEFGWVKGLRDEYQLVLIDARGHGHSDKPHESAAYDYRWMTQDVVTVLDELEIDQAHFLGFSMGGNIGFALAKYAPERLSSLIAIGSYPYTYADVEGTEEMRNAFRRGMKVYLEEAIPKSGSLIVTDWFLLRRLANDPEALIAYLDADAGSGFEDIVPNNRIPCLLYVGTADSDYPQIRRCAEEMPNTQLFTLPDKGHGDSFRAIEQGLPRVRQFLVEASRRPL